MTIERTFDNMFRRIGTRQGEFDLSLESLWEHLPIPAETILILQWTDRPLFVTKFRASRVAFQGPAPNLGMAPGAGMELDDDDDDDAPPIPRRGAQDPVQGGTARPTVSLFGNQKAKLLELLNRCGITEVSEELTESEFLVGVLNPGDHVLVEVEIDTDHKAFVPPPKGEPRQLQLTAFVSASRSQSLVQPARFRHPPAEVPKEDPIELTVSIAINIFPWTKVPEFAGAAAIDLGNTNSTVVALRPLSIHDVFKPNGGLQAVPENQTEEAIKTGTIPTAVLLTSYEERLGRFPKVEGEIGAEALQSGQSDWLILGLKRILSDPRRNGNSLSAVLRSGPVVLGREMPAQFFVSRALRAFHCSEQAMPMRLAITHPTTYSRWMVRQIEEAVTQGWRWSANHRAIDYNRDEYSLIHVTIDEASAAAIYFLLKDWVFPKGKLRRLQYVFPRGITLLIYDCGGGTTDISLVTAKAHFEQSSADGEELEYGKLEVRVLGRTGHPFGGDDITVAIFYLLKAKFSGLNEPVILAAYQAWLQENVRYRKDLTSEVTSDPFDKQIPTKFKPHLVARIAHQRRRNLAQQLWQIAEKVKIELASTIKTDGRSVDLAKWLNRPLFLQAFQAVHAHLGRPPAPPPAGSKLTITLDEVAALISPAIAESLRKTNVMLERRLPPQTEVDRVYVIGNATKFPLIKTLLEKHLHVRYRPLRMAPIEPLDLKNSVANGAALTSRLAMHGLDIAIDFDSKDLASRLPFDIYFPGLGGKGDIPLFRENTLYNDMGLSKAKRVPISPAASVNSRRQLSLYRRWPGEAEGEDFLNFQFPTPLIGPVRVWFDENDCQFYSQDEGDGNSSRVAAEEKTSAMVRSPMQSGEL